MSPDGSSASLAADTSASSTRAPVLALVGTPNSGKTTLFNALTGLSARVANYPGITVEHLEGSAKTADGRTLRVLDLPGTYSLVPRSDDEVVALRGALGTLPAGRPDLVIAVVDVTSLARNLYTVTQLRELGCPLLVALTMMDVVEADGCVVDVAELERRLGVPVVRASSSQRRDAEGVKAALPAALASPSADAMTPALPAQLSDEQRERLAHVGARIAKELKLSMPAETVGLWAASAHVMGTDDRLGISDDSRQLLTQLGVDGDDVRRSIEARHARAHELTAGIVTRPSLAAPAGDDSGHAREQLRSVTRTARLDAIVLHRIAGPALLLLIFGALFQALFSWSAPLMDGIEAIMGFSAATLGALLPEDLPLVRSLLIDGVLAGVGNVVVFVPQIAVLFLFLGLLEDSGYLARAAFLLDRLMAKVGLHGRAFVPMLSGFACAVPAILATRTIESTKDRLVTILVTPLMSCSARLPVYALIIATVFATTPPVFGFVEVGALVMIAMYGLGVVAAIGMAALFKRTLLKSPTPPLVLELPPYRVPRAFDVIKHVLGRVRIFLVEAGTVILAITVVLWGMFTFPRSDELQAERDNASSALLLSSSLDDEARAAELQKIQARYQKQSMEQSIAGRLGHAIEPVIEPLGFDWKIGVGLIASFAAREVLVSTLGLVYGLGDGSDEESVPLREAMRNDTHELSGEPVYTPRTGLALMVFFVLAMQCMSTLAVVKRETRSWRWPLLQLGYMTALAYVGALLVYQIGGLVGLA